MKKFSSQYHELLLLYLIVFSGFIIASNYNLRMIIICFILTILLTYFFSASVFVDDTKIKIKRDLAFWAKGKTYNFSDMIKIRIYFNPKASEVILYFKNGKKKRKTLGSNATNLAKYLKDYIQVEYYSGNTKIKI